jgi:hypothetical protein
MDPSARKGRGNSDDGPYVGHGGSLRERSYFAGAVAGWLMLTG